jgi:hypothetical protein
VNPKESPLIAWNLIPSENRVKLNLIVVRMIGQHFGSFNCLEQKSLWECYDLKAVAAGGVARSSPTQGFQACEGAISHNVDVSSSSFGTVKERIFCRRVMIIHVRRPR